MHIAIHGLLMISDIFFWWDIQIAIHKISLYYKCILHKTEQSTDTYNKAAKVSKR